MQNFPLEELKTWFLKKRRVLQWRENASPYAVWVSEVMLQQTQVAVVVEYFERWMQRFPSIEALAAASVDEVIKEWEGLGYYSRARNLHAGAKFLVEHYGGKLPSTREELAHVKGLGPYTIGAILSFAFHQKAAAVDGNVKRVLSRYFTRHEGIWEIAEEILPSEEPWLIVEGLIELGAMVCKKQPQCWECPLQERCRGFQQGLQSDFPRKEKTLERICLERDVFVIVYEGELLVKKGKAGKVMADLYEFPYLEREKQGFPFSFRAKKITKLSEVQHHFTRYKAKLYPGLWEALEKIELLDYDWISWQNIKQYPFSSGHRKILTQLVPYL